ncbi:hypothetical protein J6590_041670 [Homalodisca vitripennis]|nr:hypothetical protein J6590_041670 [Homalodisca vitripennis]
MSSMKGNECVSCFTHLPPISAWLTIWLDKIEAYIHVLGLLDCGLHFFTSVPFAVPPKLTSSDRYITSRHGWKGSSSEGQQIVGMKVAKEDMKSTLGIDPF